jgi:hypothetical protein
VRNGRPFFLYVTAHAAQQRPVLDVTGGGKGGLMSTSSPFKCSDCGTEMTEDEKLFQVGKMAALGWHHLFVKLCGQCQRRRTTSYVIFAVVFLTVFVTFVYWFNSRNRF